MLPTSHKIISEHVYKVVNDTLGVKLNKKQLIYGSIKPDLTPKFLRLDHFKPTSFHHIMNETTELSLSTFSDNNLFIKQFSQQLGIVTHFIADYFCVPHNDRNTYKNHLIDHVVYEYKLEKLFKNYSHESPIIKEAFNVNNYSSSPISNVLDSLHNGYTLRGESMENDVRSSLDAAATVSLFATYNAINNYHRKVA
ncbi:MAG: zinc dependent phospholipase C family protein [Clostridiales bacterium]|nr:zinc dependent phospholipase C family protein [Clostridiales bacterium]